MIPEDWAPRMHRQDEEWLRLCEAVVMNASDAIVTTEADPIAEPGPRIVFANEAFARIAENSRAG